MRSAFICFIERILRADDLLNITSGNATGICQRISENSTRHAAMEDTGRTFVVEEIDEGGNSKMVARSWVWRNNGVICFDNIELASELQNGNIEMEKQKAILEVYKSAAEIDQNPLAKNLVLETIHFYIDLLCKWLNDLNLTDKDIFLVSSIVKNGNFMEEFNKIYA